MLVFRGAEVFPGDGPSFRADVGVADGKIAAIGAGLEGEVLDAAGAILCPGLIDLHAHSALASFDDPFAPEGAAGIHHRGDLPGRARAGARLRLARAAGLLTRARG